jgi:hypothetical protein
MTDEELARVAYEAYAAETGIAGTQGARTWDQMPDGRRRGWLAAARAVASRAETVPPPLT